MRVQVNGDCKIPGHKQHIFWIVSNQSCVIRACLWRSKGRQVNTCSWLCKTARKCTKTNSRFMITPLKTSLQGYTSRSAPGVGIHSIFGISFAFRENQGTIGLRSSCINDEVICFPVNDPRLYENITFIHFLIKFNLFLGSFLSLHLSTVSTTGRQTTPNVPL